MKCLKLIKLTKYIRSIFEMFVFICWFGFLILLGMMTEAANIMAQDFGIHGHVFYVAEEDFLELINSRLKKIDWSEFNQKIQNNTKQYIERPTSVKAITNAKESSHYLYNPTYSLKEDIKDDKGEVIHKKGSEVNPLEYTKLTKSLLFIDGDDEIQVKFAIETYKNLESQLKIILVNGAPLELQRKEKIWIYFDQGGTLTNKLSIRQVPALVTQDGLNLKVEIIGENRL